MVRVAPANRSCADSAVGAISHIRTDVSRLHGFSFNFARQINCAVYDIADTPWLGLTIRVVQRDQRVGKQPQAVLCAGATLGLLAPAVGAWAQAANSPSPRSSPPPPGPSPEPEPEPGQDDIVVTAPTQQSSIDRQTYIVRDTAEARSATTTDILARIPSVEVQADGTRPADRRRQCDGADRRPAGLRSGDHAAQHDGRPDRADRGADQSRRAIPGAGHGRHRQHHHPAQHAERPRRLGDGKRRQLWQLRSSGSRRPTAPATGPSPAMLGHGRFEQRADFERERFSLQPGGPVLVSSEDGAADRRGPLLLRQRLGQLPAERPAHVHARRHRSPIPTSLQTRSSLLTAAADPWRERRPALDQRRRTSIIATSGSTIAGPPAGRAKR